MSYVSDTQDLLYLIDRAKSVATQKEAAEMITHIFAMADEINAEYDNEGKQK